MRTLQLVILAAVSSATAGSASVISGPILNLTDIDYSTSGVGFVALVNTTLTSFTFQNQGQADTVVLVNPLGDILDSVAIPAGPTVTVDGHEYSSDTVVVDWSLTAGEQYYLLQTTFDNSHFNEWLMAAPSDSEIAMTDTGDFTLEGTSNPLDSANFRFGGTGGNGTEYWAAFNNITTGNESSAPEPASLVLVLPAAVALLIRFGAYSLVRERVQRCGRWERRGRARIVSTGPSATR